MEITHPHFDEHEVELLRACLGSRWVTQGPLTQKFERLVAERQATRHALATTSCTAALHLACLALGVGRGDEVLVPAFTWVTSAHAAEYVGARVRFIDVDSDTYNLDPDALEPAITPATRAIVAVHLFGLAADMTRITAIARRHGLAVIEDAACAIGTTYFGRPVGAIGEIGCFSFHPRKVITTGEGGMVTTDRDDLAARIVSQRNHGATGPPEPGPEGHGPWTMATFDVLGYNLRLSDIQAAVGIAQMAKLDRLLGERTSAAARYQAMLAALDDIQPPAAPGGGHTYQSYVIRIREGGRPRRNLVMAGLARDGISTRPGTHAVHRLGYYRERYGIEPDAYPVAAACEDTTITLPLFPGITEDDQARVVEGVAAGLASGRALIAERGA